MAGVLTGYNGSFEFKEPGQVYGDTPYVGMRVVSTSMQGHRVLGGVVLHAQRGHLTMLTYLCGGRTRPLSVQFINFICLVT